MVTINSGTPEPDDRFQDTPREKWPTLLNAKRSFLSRRLNYDCRCLIQFREEAEEVYAELGYASSEEMIRDGYELDPSQIELAVAWLKHNEPQEQISLKAVTKKAEEVRQLRIEYPDWTQQQIADEVGCSQPYVAQVISKNCDLKETVITPESIKSSRDKADFRKLPHELQEQVRAKQISMNAAAIQAGIRKKPTPEEQCVKAFRKCDSRLVPLKVIVESLESHEMAVVMDWIKERIDGR